MIGDAADPYLYPGTTVLRNKLGLRDAAVLDRAERNLVRLRHREGVPRGAFDLEHLRAIHRHLFQDLYDWAGELRTVEVAKGRCCATRAEGGFAPFPVAQATRVISGTAHRTGPDLR